MKKVLLRKISELCRFALNDKECIKLQMYLILEDYTSARLYLDKIIENVEWTLAFDEDNEDLKSQLRYSNELIDLVIELTIINGEDGRKGSKQVRSIAQ